MDADYLVLLQDNTRNFKHVHNVGVAVDASLALGDAPFVLEPIEYLRIKIGDDWFNAFGLSVAFLGR